jgi:hypothetical protein
MPLSNAQKEVAESDHRFRVLVSGRRFGKTHLSIRELAKAASQPGKVCWYVAPTYRQAKQIVWLNLKEKLRQLNWVRKINESELTIHLINQSVISLKGADNHDSLRGVGLDFLVMDEFADIDEKAWLEVLRPTLSDTQGTALFTGTPKGIGNWSYELYKNERSNENWKSWQFTTIEGGQVPEDEIKQAKRDLDERTFRQEYEAKFETYSGIIYYNFKLENNIFRNDDLIKEHSVVHIGMDFNIDPMSAVVAVRTADKLLVVDNIEINGSNTDEMVQEIKTRYSDKKIVVYPDPASKQRKTSAGGRTDLSILLNAGFDIKMRHSHPAIRDRINAVNSALKSASGEHKLYFHPKCKSIIKTLERQVYKPGTSVPDNSGLEHMGDALGYMVEFLYPVTRKYINTNIPQTWGVKVN